MRNKFYIFILALTLSLAVNSVFAQQATRTITVITEPNAIVWIDDIKRGTTDETGKLTLKTVAPGVRKLRVRAEGFKEISQNLTAAQKVDVKVALVKTTDEAELAYQQAEKMATEDRDKSVELYKRATKLRPKYAEAYLGLARVLSEQSNMDGALQAIKNARLARPIYPEASAVEGRIYKDANEEEKAIASFKRAIREGKGFQPEALTGLGLLYRDKAEAAGDLTNEAAYNAEAAKYLQSAAKQLVGTPDGEVVYQLLGLVYEHMKKYKEAVAVYEEFLRVFPDSAERTAVESFIVQLKKQMNGEQ